jgi:hypothetical protein
MMQTIIHHPAVCLIALLFLVALTKVVDRLGLIAWLAWLGRREKDGGKKNRSEENRDGAHHSEITKEYWSIHQ